MQNQINNTREALDILITEQPHNREAIETMKALDDCQLMVLVAMLLEPTD
tara:strand:+ start:1595 stop:1744 length:150 start_codon:yes stop_codon:yes gene_type:complete